MIVLVRVIAFILLAVGLVLLGYDLLAPAGGGVRLRSLGQIWFMIDPSSLNLVQAVVERHVWEPLWDPGITTILHWPAFAVPAGLGAILLWLARKGRGGGARGIRAGRATRTTRRSS